MSYTPDSPLLGAPQANLGQLLRFLLAMPRGAYHPLDIGVVILPRYWQLARAVNIDPILAVAQSVHETRGENGAPFSSWWAQRPRRNPAGIGVTGRHSALKPGIGNHAERDGRWYEGVSFPTWKNDAIPAHLGRLLAYALRDEQATPRQRELIGAALTVRSLPAKVRGSAPILKALGQAHNPSGIGWASPGTEYGARIADLASAIGRV